MASTHSQKVLKMVNDKLLEAYEKYYGGLEIGDLSPEEFVKTYGRIEDRVNGVGIITPEEPTTIICTNSPNTNQSPASSKDSKNVA